MDSSTSTLDSHPPTYNDVVREEEELYLTRTKKFFRLIFIVCNIGLSLLAFCLWYLLRFTDGFEVLHQNVTQYCKNSDYNKIIPPGLTYFNSTYLFVLMILLSLAVEIACYKIGRKELKDKMKDILFPVWIVCMGAITLSILVHWIKIATGVPYPNFFQNKALKDYYCVPGGIHTALPADLYRTDRQLRTAFPSHRAAMNMFLLTCLVVFIDHYDIENGPHLLQAIFITLFGSKSVTLCIELFVNNEHHWEDVVAGAILGVFVGLFTMRNNFGTIFRVPAVAPMKPALMRQLYTRYHYLMPMVAYRNAMLRARNNYIAMRRPAPAVNAIRRSESNPHVEEHQLLPMGASLRNAGPPAYSYSDASTVNIQIDNLVEDSVDV